MDMFDSMEKAYTALGDRKSNEREKRERNDLGA
jgi:hypothetical protein